MVSEQDLRAAAEVIRNGELVAFPTETVYGLGANALDSKAVARIFAVKLRPAASPLIVHVSSIAMARSLVTEWPEGAQALADRFWPGPLTLVLPKRDIVPDAVTAGLSTVGIRMPNHAVALALINAARVPIAAPSANLFSTISPTTAEHVVQSLGSSVDYVLDGGSTDVGIESTVLSLAAANPVLLRPGGITRQQLEAVIGPIGVNPPAAGGGHLSPGMHPRHYSPATPLLLVNNGLLPATGRGIYLQLHTLPQRPAPAIIAMPHNSVDYARVLYSTLRQVDAQGFDWIAVERPPALPDWEAVLDRLTRAAAR